MPPHVAQRRPEPVPGERRAGPAPPVAQPVPYDRDQAFGPPAGMLWAMVSPRFTWHRRVTTFLGSVPVALAGAYLVAQAAGGIGALLWVVAVVISCGLGWIVAELAYRSWGFAERPEDLIVCHGVFVKRLVVVPYGRMQFVDVTAGLIERSMGIATVRLHTAAAATDARIPGLPAVEAARLRDRLAQRGEARSMGL
jgi:membrane protein YdbS with pleckstrin-like domain